jgi:hypothetical protein
LDGVSLFFPVAEWTAAGCDGFTVVMRAGLALGESLPVEYLVGFGMGISLRLIAA